MNASGQTPERETPSAQYSACTLWLGRHETAGSGLWVYIENVLGVLCEELGRRGISVQVVGAGKEELYQSLLRSLENCHHEISVRWLRDPLGSRHLGHLRDLIFLGNFPGIFHGMSNTLPLFGGGERNIVTIHDLLQAFPVGGKKGVLPFLKTVYYRMMFCPVLQQKADCIVVGHVSTEELLLHSYKLKKEATTHVIAPPLSDLFCEAPEEVEKTEGDSYLLAFVSSDPRKNFDRVLQAFCQQEIGTSMKVVVGNQKLVHELKQKIASTPSSSQVEVIVNPTRAELRQLFRKAAGTVFPSLAEGFGYPIYESISQGVPVLTSSNLVVSEMTLAKQLVVECEPTSTESIATGIGQLMRCELSEEVRKAASEEVRRFLSPESCVSQLLAAYSLGDECDSLQEGPVERRATAESR